MDNGTVPETDHNNQLSASVTHANELSILEMLRTLLRYKWVALGAAFTILVGAITYSFTATPLYRAEIILAPPRISTGGLGGMMSQFGGALGGLAGIFMGGGLPGGRLARGEALTTLTSTTHVQNFIQSKNLLPILFENKWDAEKGEWLVDSEEDVPTLFDGYNLFAETLLKVDEDPLTGIITLSIDWKDPDLAAQWANELVASLNTRARQRAIDSSDKTIEYLNQELERTKVVELRQALFYMIEQKIGEKTSARVEEDFAFKVVNPAIAPDIDKYNFPNRPLIIAAGLLGGIVMGIFAAFLANIWSRLRREYRSGPIQSN